MSGAKPGFLPKQLGHSLRMFFEVYTKWISSVDERLEMAKVDATIKQEFQNNSTFIKNPSKDGINE